ncbi:MAG: hypothetical protein H6574_19185 [Lewinellaceae bacterium]|nr:hypothetical protein [Lewinellaceae bacterium]
MVGTRRLYQVPEGKQDDTHLNPAGARAFAGLAVEGFANWVCRWLNI